MKTYDDSTIIKLAFYFFYTMLIGGGLLFLDNILPYTDGNSIPWWGMVVLSTIGLCGIYFIDRLDENHDH